MKLPDKVYTILKWVVAIVLPAVATAYYTFATIWDVGNADKVVATIVALTTLLGAVLGVSTAAYNASDDKYDGTIDPVFANTQTSDKALTLTTDEYDAAQKKEVLLKVDTGSLPA